MQAQSVLELPSTLLFGIFVWYVPSLWTISPYTSSCAFLICISVYPSGWIGGYLNPSTIGVWKERVKSIITQKLKLTNKGKFYIINTLFTCGREIC